MGGSTAEYSVFEGGHRFNLDEYMVTLDKPVGIRFAQTDAGDVYVEALAKGGHAERCRMIMVGDVLKKTSAVFGDAMWDVDDFGRVMYALKARHGSVNLVFERASQISHLRGVSFSNPPAAWNLGRVGVATWRRGGPAAVEGLSAAAEDGCPGACVGGGLAGQVSFMERNPFLRERPTANEAALARSKIAAQVAPSPFASVDRFQDRYGDVEDVGLGNAGGGGGRVNAAEGSLGAFAWDAFAADPDGEGPEPPATGRPPRRRGWEPEPPNVTSMLLQSDSKGNGPETPGGAAGPGRDERDPRPERSQDTGGSNGAPPALLPALRAFFDKRTGGVPIPGSSLTEEEGGASGDPSGPAGGWRGAAAGGHEAREAPGVDWQWPGIGSREDAEAEGGATCWALGGDCGEYLGALRRGAADLTYDPALGMALTHVTEHLALGSCVQGPRDVRRLAREAGITAVLSLQLGSDAASWGLDSASIEQAAREEGLLLVQYPIRGYEAVELRTKLPLAVGVLHRLLRRGHRVCVTSTTGFGRAPALAVAHLHWVRGLPFGSAYGAVTGLRPSNPNRSALVAATWDVISMVPDASRQSGPPTHAVEVSWIHGGQEVLLVGEFSGGWMSPAKATQRGAKFVLDLRLPQGKYRFKYIVDGQWQHAPELPAEADDEGNLNNVLYVGGSTAHRGKEFLRERVIERPLTSDERRVLTYVANRLAFRINPLTFSPKASL